MRPIWTHRRCLFPSAVLTISLSALPMMAQKGSPGGPPGIGSSAGTAGTAGLPGSRGTIGSIPGSTPGSIPGTSTTSIPGNGPLSSRPIFLTGKVMFDDGSQTNSNIRIERVCGGNVHLEAHTDSKGGFSLQVGASQTLDTDAADASPGQMTGNPLSNQSLGGTGGLTGGANGMNPLWNCELRAAYPGYLSDTIELANRRSMDDPNIGAIILHRAGNIKGTTISLTSAEAPKKAQKDLEKGQQLADKGQLEDAEKRLQQAVDIYPKYAEAWFTLGDVLEREKKTADARKAYLQAVSADSKYVSPVNRLALLAAEDRQWQEAADYSKQVIELNPIEFPSAFWYSAVANFNLRRMDEAQKSALALVKLDTRHRYPEAERMLAQIALSKDNYTDAANHLRAYLLINPSVADAEALKQAISKMDQAHAEARN